MVSDSISDFSAAITQVQQLQMERNTTNKCNYAVALHTNERSIIPNTSTNASESANVNDSMFLKYASSIIQVVTEQKLEHSKSMPFSNQPQSPIYEISEVDYFDKQAVVINNDYQLQQSKKGHKNSQPFKKKIATKTIMVYNFTNLTLLATAIGQAIKKQKETVFNYLKNIENKPKKQLIPPIKSRSSVGSRSTTSTYMEQLKNRRQMQALKKVQQHQQMRQAANTIKGWLQFKILIFKSSIFRELMEFDGIKQSKVELSPIASHKKDKTIQHFYLTDYQNDAEITVNQPMHLFQQSLAYTIDNNFELSKKQNTITTPEKIPSNEKLLGHPELKKHSKLCKEPSSNSQKESIVQTYQNHLKVSKLKSNNNEAQKNISCAAKIRLAVDQDRRYLAIRTGVYQLPIVSENDLRKDQITTLKNQPIKQDIIVHNQPFYIASQFENIVNDYQNADSLFKSRSQRNRDSKTNSKQLSSQNSSSKQKDLQSYFASVRQKYSKIGPEQSKGQESCTKTCKIQEKRYKTTIKETVQTNVDMVVSQQRHPPKKVQAYYFPNKEQSEATQMSCYPNIKNRLDEVKQVDSILSKIQRQAAHPAHQKLKKEEKIRFEQSIVNSYNANEQLIKKDKESKHLKINTQERKTTQNQVHYQHEKAKTSREHYHGVGNLQPHTSKLHGEHRFQTQLTSNIQMQMGPQRLEGRSPPQRYSSPYQQHPPPAKNIQMEYHNPKHMEPRPKSKIPQQRPESRIPQHRPQSRLPQQRPQQRLIPTQQRPESRIPQQRPQSRDARMPTINFNHNIYQMNQPLLTQRPTPSSNIPRNDPRFIYGHQQQHQAMQRPQSRLLSPQQPTYMHINRQHPNNAPRDNSSKKVAYFSPQMKNYHYGMQSPPIKFNHENNRPQSPQQQIHEYFAVEGQQKFTQEKMINMNNQYYTSGVVERQHHFIADNRQHLRSQPFEENRRSKAGAASVDRPHSNSRQSIDRLNIHSTLSPQQSQLQPQRRSNHLTNTSNSKLSRPRSMNQKIHITLRHDK